jgi:alpha-D-ribose 1-methylphosphonate 5-triphosphate diphosphatase
MTPSQILSRSAASTSGCAAGADGRALAIRGGRLLLPGGEIAESDLTAVGATIAEIGPATATADALLDARRLLVAPGLVDVHGDSFEHLVMPRPRTWVPLDIALPAMERQFLVNGITTGYLAHGYSWEGGLRGAERASAVADWLYADRGRSRADLRLHLRFEIYHVDGADQVGSWIESGHVSLLVFNDHLPDFEARLADGAYLAYWAERAALDLETFRARIRSARGRESEVPSIIASLARAARAHGVPVGSHDDPSPDVRARYHALGATVAEFPLDLATAERARADGSSVIMGAPNILRGGSSAGNVAARDVVAAGLCTALCTDYYVPSLVQAAFRLAGEGVAPFAAAWDLITRGPAEAVGLSDRGAIEVGRRADLVVLDDSDAARPRILATVAAGAIAYADARVLGGE